MIPTNRHRLSAVNRIRFALRRLMVVAACGGVLAKPARGQVAGNSQPAAPTPTAALLARLAGQWEMRGSVHGRPAMYRVSAQPTLGAKYIELHMRDTSPKAPYEARVFIGPDTVAGAVIVHWLDNTGAAFSIPAGAGTVVADTLRFEFAYSNGPFRDRLVYRAATRDWEVRLESGDGKGGWRLFGEYVMVPLPKAGKRT